jgi:hypothetical protein
MKQRPARKPNTRGDGLRVEDLRPEVVRAFTNLAIKIAELKLQSRPQSDQRG